MMNKFCIILSFLCTSFIGIAQTQQELDQLNKILPPNCVRIQDNLFIDETEIANIHWLEYLYYLGKDSTEAFYNSQKPDTTVWDGVILMMDSTSRLYYQFYGRYPGFRYFPVSGITYEQAVNYCAWRSQSVNNFYNSNEEILKKYPILKDYEIVFEFRLPTIEEWEYAAAGGLDSKIYPYGQITDLAKGFKKNSIKNKDCIAQLKEKQFDYKKPLRPVEFNVKEDFLAEDNSSVTCDVTTQYIYQNKPNAYKLYNMIGNVSEMTSTKGIAKGGSLNDSLFEISIQKEFIYYKPEFWLGFRCACAVSYRKRNK